MAVSTSATQTATDVASNTITTFAMTAVFTPPTSCSSSWTYEPEAANDVYGGLLLQNAAADDNANTACFPPHFDHYGRKTATAVFSPGFCPVGYTSADLAVDQPVTTAVCCLSGYTYYTETVEGVGVYAGCTRMFPSTTSTIVTIRQSPSHSTQVTGPITMWAQPITIELESSDSSLFTTQSTSTRQATAETSTTSAEAKGTSTNLAGSSATGVSITSAEAEGTSTNLAGSSATSVSRVSESSNLSKGAGIGIGVGIGVGVAVLSVIAFYVFRRRRATKRTSAIKAPYQESHYNETRETVKMQAFPPELYGTGHSVSRNVYELGI